MCLRGPNNVQRAMQIDPTLLCCALEQKKKFSEQKKCWELLAQTVSPVSNPNNTQQHATGCANGHNT